MTTNIIFIMQINYYKFKNNFKKKSRANDLCIFQYLFNRLVLVNSLKYLLYFAVCND